MRARFNAGCLIVYPRYGGCQAFEMRSFAGKWRFLKWYWKYMRVWDDQIDSDELRREIDQRGDQ